MGKLIRQFIQSPNYVAGSAGWTINKDGSSEFNNITARGTVDVKSPVSGSEVLIAVNANQAQIFLTPDNTIAWDPGRIVALNAGSNKASLTILSPRDTTGHGQAGITLTSDTGGSNTIALITGDTIIIGNGNSSTAQLPLLAYAQTLNYYTLPLNVFTAETWHAMTLQNGWTNRGGGFVSAQYRKVACPPNSVQLTGCILAGTKVNGTVVANLPVGYRPNNRHGFPVQDTNNPAALEFATNGDLMIFDLNAGNNVQFNVVVPLDA